MTNIIPFPQRARTITTDQQRRIADKIESLVRAEIPYVTNIRVESIETICVCRYRDLYGPLICDGCPENTNPNGAA